MFIISYASECYHHVASCSADEENRWNKKRKGLLFPAQGSGLIWSWSLKKINKFGYNPIDPSSMQTQTSEELKTRITLVSFNIAPLAIFFFSGYIMSTGPVSRTKIVFSDHWIQWRNICWALNICQSLCRTGGYKRNKTRPCFSRNSYSC